jgi:N-terminal domain of anti-restriction factor ArdC
MIGNSSRKDETLERLTNGIAQLTSSDSWRAWLKAQARFHQYSFSNTVLILCQRSTASRVAGFHTWRRLGRVVRRGESALWIFAPMTRRVASDDDPEQSNRLVSAFRPVPVFDISQTEGDPASCATTWPSCAPKDWCNASAARGVIVSPRQAPRSASCSSSYARACSAPSLHSPPSPTSTGHRFTPTSLTRLFTRLTPPWITFASLSVSSTQREPDFRCSASQNLS